MGATVLAQLRGPGEGGGHGEEPTEEIHQTSKRTEARGAGEPLPGSAGFAGQPARSGWFPRAS